MRIRMSFAQELPILTGTVTANALDGALTLAYTVSTGDYTDVIADQEVEIRRAGVFVGRLRVRGSGTTSTVLPVGEFSKGMVTVLAGDTLAVLASWRIRYRLPSADEDFAPDHEVYTDQHEFPAPIACSGKNAVGFAADLNAVQHDGSLSRNVAFGSLPSNVGHSWDMPNGNTSSSASPVFDYSGLSAGTFWGGHTVTDLTTGKTTTQRKVVRVHDDSDLPYEVLDAQLNGTPDSGSTLEVTLPDTVDIEDVADGAMGWLWIEGGGILYEGYLLGDSIQKDPQTETISFRMTSARGILELLPGFSTVLETVFTPTNWLEAFATTVNAAIVYRLRELTTVEVTCDIEISTGIDYPYPLYYLQESVPYAQVLELADAKDCLFTCTRTNLLRVVKPTWLMTDGERAAADIQQAFDADNVFTLDETREHRYPYSQVEGSGFAGDAPLFSRAPGNAPAEGPQKTTAERMITVSQGELNQRTGRRYGRLNALLFGKPIRKSSLNVLPTLYGLDPAYVDQFVTLDGITTKRGLTHDNTRMSLESVSESYSADTNGGLPEIDADLQEETDGVPGVTYVPPSEADTGIPAHDPYPYDPFVPSPPSAQLGGAIKRIAFFGSDNYVYITLIFNAAFPTWVRYALSVSGNVVDFVVDAFSPLYLGTGSTVNGYLITDSATDAIVYIADIFGARTLTVLKTSMHDSASASGRGRWAESSFGANGHLVVVSNYGSGGGTYYTYSTDANDGSPTWATETQVTAHYQTNAGSNANAGIALSSKAPGTGYLAAYTATGLRAAAEAELYSLSSGFSAVTPQSALNTGDITPAFIHIPFHDNPGDAIVWYPRTLYSGINAFYELKRRTAGGVDAADYAPQVSSLSAYAYGRRSFDTGMTDRRRLVYCATNRDTSAGGVFVSRDEGVTWTEIDSTTTYRSAAIAGDNPDKIYLWGVGGAVAFVPDFATVVDRSGNLPTDYPSAGTFVGLAGG